MSVVWQLCMVLGLGAFSRYPPATMISRLPLAGTLYDDVQGTYALFVRDSSAYSADGQEVPPHTPRFETFAAFDNVEFETLSNGSNIAVYAHIGGTLYGSEYSPDCDGPSTLYFSTNGVNWQPLNEFHNTVRSAHVTDQGTLLVATARCQPVRIYRSEDGGQTFTVVAEFPYGRTVRHWGWAGQGDEVYITFHNGRYSSNNPRRIYRSLDDGRTWELFYEPPNQEGVHAHAIAFDPENRVVYYCHGDDLKGILRSADEGQTWEVLSLVDQPTGAVNRPDGVFFLSDTYRTAIITELDKSTGELLGRANLPEGPWGWHLLDDGGIMYAALQDYWFGKQGMVLASPDGRHWGILRRFSSGEQGPYSFAGTTELGYQWAVYLGVPDSPAVNVRFRTPTIKTVPGIRLEPGLVNLLASPEESSAEGGDGGWYADQGGVLEQVTDRSHSGQAAWHVTNPYDVWEPCLNSAVIQGSFPAGTTVAGTVWAAGRGAGWLLTDLYDVTNQVTVEGPALRPRANWVPVTTSMTLSQPSTALQLRLRVHGPSDLVDDEFWVDSVALAVGHYPINWQMGGQARAPESLRHSIDYPSEWTDLLFWQTDQRSPFVPQTQYVIKSWVQDPDHYMRLVLDTIDSAFKLVTMQEGVETTVTSVPVGAYMEKMLFKFAVVNGADESSLHVFWAEPEMAAGGPRVDLDFNEVFLGSDPAAANQAHGLYALAMTFDQALDAEQIGRQITLALGGQPAPPASVPGDLDQNGVVNLSDFATFAFCYLGSVVPAVPGCALADLDGDGDVDLADFATFAVSYGS